MRKRLTQSELVEAHAPHLAPLIAAALITAASTGAQMYANAKTPHPGPMGGSGGPALVPPAMMNAGNNVGTIAQALAPILQQAMQGGNQSLPQAQAVPVGQVQGVQPPVQAVQPIQQNPYMGIVPQQKLTMAQMFNSMGLGRQ